MCEFLQADLHSVETAFSGSDALEKFRTSPFDVVITDHVMAGMTGRATRRRHQSAEPENPSDSRDRLRERLHSRKTVFRGDRPRPRQAPVTSRAPRRLREGDGRR